MKSSYSKKILALSLIVLFGVLILDVIFTDLLLHRIVGINDKVKQITISTQERERSFALQDSIINSQSERDELEKYFVQAGDAKTAEFISYLESLAKESSVSVGIRSVNYASAGELSTSDVVSIIRFRLNATGKWNNVINFLTTIENLPKAILVEGVSLEVEANIWSVDIGFSVAKLKK